MYDRAFTKTALDEYEVPLVKRVNQLAEGIVQEARENKESGSGSVVDLSNWIKRFTCVFVVVFFEIRSDAHTARARYSVFLL